MPDPTSHDAWAEVYDLVYAEEFGALLEGLTDRTLELVCILAKPPAAVVEFGAGTGRLAIPLASVGYRVVAVEPSAAMLGRLAGKPGGDAVRRVVGRVQDYAGDMRFDLALCVFGVLSYLTTRAQLDAGLAAVRASRSACPPLHVAGLRSYFKVSKRWASKKKMNGATRTHLILGGPGAGRW
jgi:SAM-dependent methyltransferase